MKSIKSKIPKYGHSKPGYGRKICKDVHVLSDQRSRKLWRDLCKAKGRMIGIEVEIMEMDRIRLERKRCQEESRELKKEVKERILEWKILSLENETLKWQRQEEKERQERFEDDLREKVVDESGVKEYLKKEIDEEEHQDDLKEKIDEESRVKKYLKEKIDEEKRVKERKRHEDMKRGKVLEEEKILFEECGRLAMKAEDRKVGTLIDCYFVSIEEKENDLDLERGGEKSEEVQEKRRRPRKRSNFRRFGIELGNRENYVADSVAVRKTGGLASRGVERLRCGASELPARGLAWCTVKTEFGRSAGEDMEEDEEMVKLEKKELDDGKGVTLG